MNLRIARKIGKRCAPSGSPKTGHNPEQKRRAALRLHRKWWRTHCQKGNSRYNNDNNYARWMCMKERRRRHYNHYLACRAAGVDDRRPRRAGFWPYDPWPPDGVRAAFSLRGLPWLPSWLGARRP